MNLGEPEPIESTQSPAQDADMAQFLRRIMPEPAQGRALLIHYSNKSPEAIAALNEWRRKNGKSQTDAPPLPGEAFHSIDEATSCVTRWLWRQRQAGAVTVDFYFCVSLCSMASLGKAQSGRQKWFPSRTKGSMVASRILCADLDVKTDAYKTQDEALQHVDSLVAAGKLPNPTVRVNSGSGVHLYWVMDREMRGPERQALGTKWGAYLTSIGVHHDASVASDIVRVLRLPQTFNVKNISNPLPTSVIGVIDPNDLPMSVVEGIVGPVTQAAPARPGVAAPIVLPAAFAAASPAVAAMLAAQPVGRSEFSAGINDHVGQPVDFQKVVDNCPTLTDILNRAGNGDSEPLWSLAILASTFAADGRAWAHRFSSGDPRYAQTDTDAKYDQKVSDRAASGGRLGWPSCAAFSQHSAQCQSCPLFNQGKTPFHVAKDDSDLPEGYYRQNGQLMVNIKEDDVNAPAVVMPYGVLDVYLEHTPLGPAINMQIIHAKDQPRRLVIPIAAAVAWRDSAVNALGAAGVALLPDQLRLTRTFIVAFIQLLQKKQETIVARDSFGWTTTREGKRGFAYGERVYTENGEEQGVQSDRELSWRYSPTGDVQAWKTAADLIMGMQRIDIECIVATAFAGPLIEVSGHSGVIFAACTPESGVQKSSALKLAQSVWGHPVRAMSRLDDTTNQVGRKLGTLRHIPVFWDEIQSDAEADNFARIAFILTTGVEKGRLNADATLKASGSWATMLTAASNPSIRDILLRSSTTNTAAGINRLFQIEVKKVPLATSAASAQMVLGELEGNYGGVGALYAALLASQRGKLKERLRKVSESFETAVQATADERYWILAASTLLMGAALANTLEGGTLIQFNLPKLKAFLIESIKAQRLERAAEVQDTNSPDFALQLLNDYINHSRTHNTCLETATLAPKGGRPTGTTNPVEYRMPSTDSLRMLRSVQVHLVHDDGVLRVTRAEFRHWMQAKKVPFSIAKHALETHAGMKESRGRWAAYTPWRGPALNFYEFDLTSKTAVGARFGLNASGSP
jgi:hypothetical protein